MSDFEGYGWGEFDDAERVSDQEYNDYWSDGGNPYDGTDNSDPGFYSDGPDGDEWVDDSDPEPDDGEGPFPVLTDYGRARLEEGDDE